MHRQRFPPLSPTRLPPKAAPLWPFLLIAAFIVAAAGAIGFAYRRAAADLQISAKVHGTPTPTAQRPQTQSPASRTPTGFAGSGAWLMSSLPECFFEQDHIEGGVAELRSKFPPAASRVAAGVIIRSRECTIEVRLHEVWITRGGDRLLIPPEAQLYRSGDRLTLVWLSRGRAEIRHYCPGFDAARCPTQSAARRRASRMRRRTSMCNGFRIGSRQTPDVCDHFASRRR